MADDDLQDASQAPPSDTYNNVSPGVRHIIAQEWQNQGASPNAIAGVLANVHLESNFNPTLRHFDQPGYTARHGLSEASYAHGLYQEGADEWNNYAQWLRQNHPDADWRDPALQSRFAAWNLKTRYPDTWAAMNAGDASPGAAAWQYAKGYLKPAPQFLAQRYHLFNGGSVQGLDDWLAGKDPEFHPTGAGIPGGALGAQNGAPVRTQGTPRLNPQTGQWEVIDESGSDENDAEIEKLLKLTPTLQDSTLQPAPPLQPMRMASRLNNAMGGARGAPRLPPSVAERLKSLMAQPI